MILNAMFFGALEAAENTSTNKLGEYFDRTLK